VQGATPTGKDAQLKNDAKTPACNTLSQLKHIFNIMLYPLYNILNGKKKQE
jgi:hypothetical protein